MALFFSRILPFLAVFGFEVDGVYWQKESHCCAWQDQFALFSIGSLAIIMYVNIDQYLSRNCFTCLGTNIPHIEVVGVPLGCPEYSPICRYFSRILLGNPICTQKLKLLGFREYFTFFEPNMEGELLANILPESHKYSPIYHKFS